MSLSGRRIAILAEREYEDLELWYPRLRLQEAGATVVVAGPLAQTYPSKHGYPVSASAAVSDLDPTDFDGVVVPGGWAPDHLRRSHDVVAFVAAISAQGGLVAAICHGGSVLVSADVVRGRRLTSSPAIQDDLRNAGAEWTDSPVVVDGTLVTSRSPGDLPFFLPAILTVLDEEHGHRETGARLAVDTDLVEVALTTASLEYMLEMLARMPAAKDYREGTALGDCDPGVLVRDFAALSDPRGSLEAEATVVVDVSGRGGGYVARGNARLATVLQQADVPDVG
jgi:protease I